MPAFVFLSFPGPTGRQWAIQGMLGGGLASWWQVVLSKAQMSCDTHTDQGTDISLVWLTCASQAGLQSRPAFDVLHPLFQARPGGE